MGVSFGYIIGYVLAAAICGRFAERGADRSIARALRVMLAAEIVLYAAALTWLALYANLGPAAAVREGLTRFIAGDIIKAVIAADLLPVAWRLAGRRAIEDEKPMSIRRPLAG